LFVYTKTKYNDRVEQQRPPRILPHLVLPLSLCVVNGVLWHRFSHHFSSLGLFYGGAVLLVMLGLAVRAWWAQHAAGAGMVTPSGKSGWMTAVGYVLAGVVLSVTLLVLGESSAASLHAAQ
jgi:hypothetical protein